jgi:uncharacterized protein
MAVWLGAAKLRVAVRERSGRGGGFAQRRIASALTGTSQFASAPRRLALALRQFTLAPAQVALAFLLSAVCALAIAQDLQPVPALMARVTDVTGTLTPEQQASVEQKLAAFEARKGAQLAVLIVPTTQPEEIEQYSIRVVDQWKLGRQKIDDGALLLVAKNDRRMRIEVGRGLEGVLTDATSRRIIAETITPLFRQGDFFGGINAGIDQMIRVADGEPLPPPDRRWRGGNEVGKSLAPLGNALPFTIFAVIIAASMLRRMLGRGVGAVATGGIAAVLVWLFTHFIVFAVIAGAIAFLLTLLAGIPLGGGGSGWSSPRRGRRGDHFGGGFGGFGGGGWGGGRGGGFGGGGFSGGGGGFSGGGASGSW